MAYDETLAARIRALLAAKKGITEKKMFGGLAFLLGGRMCCGVLQDRLVARIGVDGYAAALRQPQVSPMDFTGRPMAGYVYVAAAALRTARDLQAWTDRCIAHADTLPAKPAKKRSAARSKK